MARLSITHDYVDGTRLTGSRKGDGVLEIARRHGFDWRRASGIHIPRSRDRDAQTSKIEGLAAELREAGHTVDVEIDNTARTAVEWYADRSDRSQARADRFDIKADRAAAESTAYRDQRRAITDGIPLAQPVQPPGHHSRKSHLRALDRADNYDRKSHAAAGKAEHYADRADGARRNEAHKNNPRAIMRRIETLETEHRQIGRALDGYTRESRNGRGQVYAWDEHPAATGERREALERHRTVVREETEYLRGELGQRAESGEFVAWSREHFQPGDRARASGHWHEVARVNAKSVSVRCRWPWSTASDKAEPVKWDQITGRRRDSMQWETPHGELWPVELADRVERWLTLVNSAQHGDRAPFDSDEARQARTVSHARRVVHGLPLTATTQEVHEIARTITETDQRRELAAASLAIFHRLTAGERVADIAATTTPITGAPAWRLPTDREPVDRRAAQCWPKIDDEQVLQPGDLIEGVRDGFSTMRRLSTSIVGPVAHVSEVLDRREAGQWVTVTRACGPGTRSARIAGSPCTRAALGATATRPTRPQTRHQSKNRPPRSALPRKTRPPSSETLSGTRTTGSADRRERRERVHAATIDVRGPPDDADVEAIIAAPKVAGWTRDA
jgi:hypothetical protein